MMSLWHDFKILTEKALEALYPSNIYCICCDNLIDATRPYALCDECVRNLHWANEKTCGKCGKILSESWQMDLCHDCMEIPHTFEKGFACVEYGMYEKLLLRDYKYHGKAYYGEKLAELMTDRFALEELEVDCIVPVPMHKKKEQKRGYNQAALLSRGMARRMGKKWAGDILLRSRQTSPMNNLSPHERRENVRDAFTLNPKKCKLIENKTLLLVDDIFTTGSTLDECSKVLLEQGARRVYAICFAAGSNRRRLPEEEGEEI